MRLFFCFLASVLLHLLFLRFKPESVSIPSLAISLEPEAVSLQIRTQMKREEVSPEPPKDRETPQPTPKPERKIAKSKEVAPPKTPLKEKREDKKEPVATADTPKEYVSEPRREPRMVERAEYLSNPAPEYPLQARRRRQQGTVTFLVQIDEGGRVKSLSIKESSGYPILDKAGEQAVSRWRFSPAMVGERGVASWVVVPVLFQLRG